MSERREQPEAAQALYEADPYEYGDARKLMEELELAEPIAITLVRRGHRTPERARSFLEAAERHDPGLFRGIDDAVGLITLALDAGSRITVHGDYDVDGISATAILVSALRRAGGECDWLIPDRTADGYGLSPQTVEGLAERGTELLITADCGITSVEEVALATELGLEVIVTDHHRPGEQLPACPIVHPEVSEYPFDGLCGAAVAHKLVERLEDSLATAGGAVERAGNDLDLVALATVADMVPLVDENRTLAREGIAELRRARRPGIRALLEVSGVEPEHLDEGDIAFRVAPRINAAGRLYRADAGVELMLTADGERAAEIAKELDAANGERRTVEREVSNGANAALRELPEELREAPGLVLAGEGWHPGVVGIAASRIVERHGRPAVLLSIEGDRAKGSGRSVPGFDLLAALAECSPLLDRYGGHRAAAGVELDAARVDDFREAFAKAAAVQLPAGSAETAERIDAVVGAEALDHDLAEQLGTLGPFGQGNPEVRLLVPWARVGDVRTMGEEGRHARFSVSSGPAKAAGVAFNANGALSRAQEVPSDLTVRLELNRWNGAVEPRAVLQSSRPGGRRDGEPTPDDGPVAPPCACAGLGEPAGRWSERFEAELEAEPASVAPLPSGGGSARGLLEHPRRSAVALIGELLSSGGRVLVLCADARRRAGLATLAAGPDRFGGSHAVVCPGCPAEASAGAARAGEGSPRLLLSDWDALELNPAMPGQFEHVVCVDPPPEPRLAELISAAGAGYLHMALAGAGELPGRSWAERWQPRALLAELYRAALEAPAGLGEGELAGEAEAARDPVLTARCVRVLRELGIAELGGSPAARTLRVVSSERTELERSAAWRAYTARYEDGVKYLQSQEVS